MKIGVSSPCRGRRFASATLDLPPHRQGPAPPARTWTTVEAEVHVQTWIKVFQLPIRRAGLPMNEPLTTTTGHGRYLSLDPQASRSSSRNTAEGPLPGSDVPGVRGRAARVRLPALAIATAYPDRARRQAFLAAAGRYIRKVVPCRVRMERRYGRVLPDGAIHHRQSQPRPFADSLGREERLEEPGAHVLGHARAGIGDFKQYVFPGSRIHVLPGILLVELDVRGPDFQPSAFAIASRALTMRFRKFCRPARRRSRWARGQARG